MRYHILKFFFNKNNLVRIIFLSLFFFTCKKDKKNKDSNQFIKDKEEIAGSSIRSKKKNIIQNQKSKTFKISEIQKDEKVLVIMLHGLIIKDELIHSKNNLKKMSRELKKSFPSKQLELLFLEIGDSVEMHIYNQAKVVYKKIIKFLKLKKLKRKTRIILIGHSAGGLVSYELYKSNHKNLNIKGIITISCPWRGTNLANNNKEMRFPLKILIGDFRDIYSNKKCGIRDVTPNSNFLKWVEKNIKTCKIPIWALGGKTNYYTRVFSIKLLKNICFKKECTEQSFFGSDEHDGVVPLYSQLGKGLENIKPIIIKENVNHSLDIKCSLSDYAIKAVNFIGKILPYELRNKLLEIRLEKAITESTQTINIVKNFIKKYGFEKNKSLKSKAKLY